MLRWATTVIRPSQRLGRIHAVVTLANVVTAVVIYVSMPRLREDLYSEGHLVETLSALLFLGSFLVGLVAVLPRRRQAWTRYGLVPALGLLCFLEEMSWGAWELGFTAPRVLGVTIDGVHDLPALILHTATGGGGNAWSRLLVVMLTVIALLGARPVRAWLVPGIVAAWSSWPWRFLVLSIGFIGVAQILDLVAIDSNVRRTSEEVLEMNGGLALLFSAISIHVERRSAVVVGVPEPADHDGTGRSRPSDTGRGAG